MNLPDDIYSQRCLRPCATTRPRHASTLLVFDAVEDTIVQIEAKLSYRRCTVCSLQSVVYFPF
jgi:hypothetical protein